MQIEEEQTIQWPKETGQKDKQRSTKHCTENKRLSNTNPLKIGGEFVCSGMVSSSCSTSDNRHVTLVTKHTISHE